MSLNDAWQDIYLYDKYVPAFKNLYTVEISDPYSSEELAKETTSLNGYVKFHATSVSFDGESLTLNRNNVTKQWTLPKSDGYTLANELKITWRENEAWRVKKFHENWLTCFYNRNTDQYISGLEGKKRIFTIHFPSGESKKYKLILEGVYPKGTPNFDFKWSTNGEIVTHQITYYVTSWHWEEDREDLNDATEK